VKVCENCGAAQPQNVQFYAPAEAQLIQGEAAARIAQFGPDIHCGFCGTRNPGNAEKCSQCGGDLKEGHARQAGREMQRETPVIEIQCTNCGEANPSTRTMCAKCGAPLPKAGAKPAAPVGPATAAPDQPSAKNRWMPWLVGGGIFACLAILCISAFLLFAPSKSVSATVTDVYWQTSVPLQEVRAAHYSDEAGSPPSGAYDVSCRTDTRQVCQDKTVDKGNGYAEVVTECHDETQDYCSYNVDEWTTIQTYTLDGHTASPRYASPVVSSSQRLGSQSVTFSVYFEGGGKSYTYNPGSLFEFQKFNLGSTWTLHLNALGIVVSVD
jgi:ribosomal protein L40E